MKLQDFDYNLPKELIAQKPVKPRDHSRLLVLDKKTGAIEHKNFYDIVDYLQAGDILIMNNSKVFPARLLGNKKDSGGKMEVFLHHHTGGKVWQCLVGGRGARPGLEIIFAKKLSAKILENNNDGTWRVEFNKSKKDLMLILQQIGMMPLPPYIEQKSDVGSRISEKSDYQTVFADEKKTGSVAAPTAGLHFTPALLKKIKAKGVIIDYVTLHVGLGTFAPVKVDDIKKHKMHAEWVEISAETMARIYLAKHEKRRVITVGTTSTRSLEAMVSQFPISNFQFPNNDQFSTPQYKSQFKKFQSWVDIFIYPGYKFKVVDAMITNFHLPKSTLLMLISAFVGKDKIDRAYREAVKEKYRFFSYGDAMMITMKN